MTPVPTPEAVLDLLGAPRPRVLIIDGRSGAGKTSLAETLVPLMDAQILHMDDLYRGWEGLLQAPALLEAALSTGSYRRYDWAVGELAESRTLDHSKALIVEGCGSLTSNTLIAARVFASPEAVRSVWIDCPAEQRQERALARDGDLFRPHWEEWAKQEDRILNEEHSRELADVRVTSGITHERGFSPYSD